MPKKKITVVCTIVQVIVIKACVCACVRVCVREGHVLLNVRVSLRVVSLVLIRAEGFTASNTLSWRGTSDILFTSLPLWATDALWGGRKKKITCNILFLYFSWYGFVVYCSWCFYVDKCRCWATYGHIKCSVKKKKQTTTRSHMVVSDSHRDDNPPGRHWIWPRDSPARASYFPLLLFSCKIVYCWVNWLNADSLGWKAPRSTN